MFLKEVSYAHQGYIYLIKNSINNNISKFKIKKLYAVFGEISQFFFFF